MKNENEKMEQAFRNFLEGNPLYRFRYERGIRNSFPAQEVSIPYYDLKELKEA